jgi:hypothetical protein
MKYRPCIAALGVMIILIISPYNVLGEKVTKPGAVRVVIKLEGIRYDGKTGPEYIDNCTIPNGELTDDEIQTAVQKDKKFYTGNYLYRPYYNLSGEYVPNLPSIKEDCAGHTTWLMRNYLGDPSIPKIRMGGGEFAIHILYPFTEGEKKSGPAVGDVVCWGEVPVHQNPEGMDHITYVKRVNDYTMIIESKNRYEAIWDYETEFKLNGNRIWNMGNPMHNIEPGTKAFLYGKPHAQATWFYWTPNWVDSGKGINLKGKWHVKGKPDAVYEITQMYRIKAMPLMFKKHDGTDMAFGAFQGPKVLYRTDWKPKEINFVRAGNYSQDEIRWRDLIGPGEKVINPPEIWVRVQMKDGFRKGDSLIVDSRFGSSRYKESISEDWEGRLTIISRTIWIGDRQSIEWKCNKSKSPKRNFDLMVKGEKENLSDRKAQFEKSRKYEMIEKTYGPPNKMEFVDLSEYDTAEAIVGFTEKQIISNTNEIRQKTFITYCGLYREEFLIYIRMGYHDSWKKNFKPDMRQMVERSQKLIDNRFTDLKAVRTGHNRLLNRAIP